MPYLNAEPSGTRLTLVIFSASVSTVTVELKEFLCAVMIDLMLHLYVMHALGFMATKHQCKSYLRSLLET